MKLPQLSLRDLFWLVALVAMSCGWWVNHHSFEELQRLREEAIAAEKRAANEGVLAVMRAGKVESKMQYRELKLSERERALQAKEDEDEAYRKAYFYYREQLPTPADDGI
jgi:hypothetical protein